MRDAGSHQTDDTRWLERQRRETRVLGTVKGAKVTVEIAEEHCS